MTDRLAIALAQLNPTVGAVQANPFAYQFEELAPGVWGAIRPDPLELPQEGNAVFVVTRAGVVLFDAGGSPAMGEAIVAKVKSLTSAAWWHSRQSPGSSSFNGSVLTGS